VDLAFEHPTYQLIELLPLDQPLRLLARCFHALSPAVRGALPRSRDCSPTQEFVKLRGHLNVQGARALVNGGMVMMDTASYTPLKVIRNRGEETVLVH
jgi:hypothetical protein